MAGALLLAISRSLRQYTTIAISLLRLQIALMDLTLDCLIPIIHAPISLEPYWARTWAAKAQEKDLGKDGTKERTNVAEINETTRAATWMQKETPVRRRGKLMVGKPQKVGFNPPRCKSTCGTFHYILQKHWDADSSELTMNISLIWSMFLLNIGTQGAISLLLMTPKQDFEKSWECPPK